MVKERNPSEMRDLPSRYVEISTIEFKHSKKNNVMLASNQVCFILLSLDFPPVHAFDTEFFICGLAPLVDQLVTLYFVKESSDHMVELPHSQMHRNIYIYMEWIDGACRM